MTLHIIQSFWVSRVLRLQKQRKDLIYEDTTTHSMFWKCFKTITMIFLDSFFFIRIFQDKFYTRYFLIAQPIRLLFVIFTHYLVKQTCIEMCLKKKTGCMLYKCNHRLLRQNKNKIHSFHLKITTACLTNLNQSFAAESSIHELQKDHLQKLRWIQIITFHEQFTYQTFLVGLISCYL